MAASRAVPRARLLTIELALPVLLVLGYQRVAVRSRSGYFPTVGRIWRSFRRMWFGAGFRDDILPSLSNLARGYVLGVVLGLLVGVLLWRVPFLRRALSPVISFALTLPPVALIPLFIVAFSLGSRLQVGIILYAVFFGIAVTTADALRSVDPILHDVASTYGLRGVRRVVRVMLPAAAPAILGAARSSLGVALLVMIVSELTGASNGIGARTITAQQSFLYADMWAGMLLLSLLGYLLNRLFTLVERPILRRVNAADQIG